MTGKYRIFFLGFCLFFLSCTTGNGITSIQDSPPSVSTDSLSQADLLSPPVDGESILNEAGEVVLNNIYEPEFFQASSRDPLEYFRVIIASDKYLVRQIRGSSLIQRKPDIGGDDLVREEIRGFDLVNLVDDGILFISLNSNTGNLEVINFDRRVPRINNIAKIIQNDATRWQFLHELKDEKPQITKFRIYYRIELKQTLTKEEIREKYYNKKK